MSQASLENIVSSEGEDEVGTKSVLCWQIKLQIPKYLIACNRLLGVQLKVKMLEES